MSQLNDPEPTIETEFTGGDSSNLNQSFEDWKNNTGSFLPHPEGSFMALVNDNSEENIAKLIHDITISEEKSNLTLDTILPEIREEIWKRLPCSDLTSIRGTCKKFYNEINNEIGIQLFLVDSDEQSLSLALTSAIERLIITHMEMTTLSQLVPAFPLRLQELVIQRCVSQQSIHEILLRCPNIHTLEIGHVAQTRRNSSIETECGSVAIFKDWFSGNLLRPESEIRYTYGMFSKLQTIRFKCGGSRGHHKENLLVSTLLTLLNCVQSPRLSIIDISISIRTLEESKAITDSLFQLFLRTQSLKKLHLHYQTELHNFEPVINVDVNHKMSQYEMKFSENRSIPQFQSLKLEMCEYSVEFFDWLFLLRHQRRLQSLIWDLGGHYWLHFIDSIKTTGKTLESLTLRTIRCYQMEGEAMIGYPMPLPMSNFREFIVLKSLHLIGMELSTCQISFVELLPMTIENLQIESFQIGSEQLLTIHRTLVGLKFLSINNWNVSRDNFVLSLKTILEIVSRPGKIKAMTFLEKSMYTSMEELREQNELLNVIKETTIQNSLQVDNVTGDNGIGFILVIGQQSQCKSTELKK